MEYKRESQFTNNASKRVFEEVYTNEDMPYNKANISNGCYMLRTPQMFAADLSQEKAISPRRVMCEPKSHTFLVRVSYYDPTSLECIDTTPFISFDFTSENKLEECLNHMRNKFMTTVLLETYGINYTFDKLKGILNIYAHDINMNHVLFRFECLNYDEYNNLWGLFNQIGMPFNSAQTDTTQYTTDTLSPTLLITLNNVWNRDPLYVHTSFSSTKKHYLCRTGDFWFKPSKYYYDNITTDEFDIFFTTDGTHWIIPYDAVKVIELCFILRQFARL